MKRTTLLILCAALAVALAGCASNPASPLPTPSPVSPTMMPPTDSMMPSTSMMPDGALTPGSTTMPEAAGMISPADAKAAAKKVSDEVVKLSEIDKATTMIVGNTALIGVNFTAQYKGQMTTRIKDMVIDRAKKAAPQLKKVAVTADPDLLARIQAMADQMTDGTDSAQVSTEFSEIVNRIAPNAQ